MIDWAPEAIEAAHRAMFQGPYDGTTAAMIGAGLDAAAAAQGIKDEEITRLREENARLRRLVKTAYAEGCYDSTKTEKTQEEFEAIWQESFARAAIREGDKG